MPSARPFTPREAAARWSISVRQVYRLIETGELQCFRVGGKTIRIKAEEIERWESGSRR